jgi:glycerophosphoryl diester phosphodiesterase
MVTELVANAHDLKLGVHPYTFRADALPDFDASREELRSLFLVQVGVHGLFTDHPDRVAAFLRAQAN